MPEIVLIIIAVGAVIVSLAKTLPVIIWSIRCPADSEGYIQPPIFPPLPADEREAGRVRPRH